MKIAVFTIVRNEEIFLPVWLKHYRRYFDNSDIYILDNDTDDGSTDRLENVRKITCGKSFSVDWLRNNVQTFQRELLEKYDYVLFSEVDELVFPDNANTFEGFINITYNKKTYKCNGYEIVQQLETEKPIDITKPIMSQRLYWYKSNYYCKCLLTSEPLYYSIGFHTSSYDSDIDENLVLIHLHKIDYNLNKIRNAHRLNKPVDELAIKNNQGWQCFTLDDKHLLTYWNKKYSPLTDIEKIPEKYKTVI